ncbi:MAG: NADH-quinone oxidoreductase subunit A [Aigarchaeota archaeon]|nr:NADH-quinone oxidoreductase subunit A [Aigarchaeota archaeon]MDW8092151.1 NADH-quinone oxidoreductase subunit A [Nitrososphaerota archaeon]
MSEFGPLSDPFVLYVILLILAPIGFYEISWLLAPSRPKRIKRMAFESGQTPIPWSFSRYPIEYFPYVIIYVSYAVLALIAFFSVTPLLVTREGALRALIVIGAITLGSFYLSTQIPKLKQRV